MAACLSVARAAGQSLSQASSVPPGLAGRPCHSLALTHEKSVFTFAWHVPLFTPASAHGVPFCGVAVVLGSGPPRRPHLHSITFHLLSKQDHVRRSWLSGLRHLLGTEFNP